MAAENHTYEVRLIEKLGGHFAQSHRKRISILPSPGGGIEAQIGECIADALRATQCPEASLSILEFAYFEVCGWEAASNNEEWPTWLASKAKRFADELSRNAICEQGTEIP